MKHIKCGGEPTWDESSGDVGCTRCRRHWRINHLLNFKTYLLGVVFA